MKKIKIGIIGCGVVGGGVFRLLEKNASLIAEKHGFEFEVKRIADLRSPAGIPAKLLTKNAQDLINDSEISIVVETIGGIHPALEFILAALKAGKSVVSANKELIAKEGEKIFAAARAAKRAFLFEASVAGSIPIIAALKNNLSSNQVKEIYGIVNGTTNYILTKMAEEGKDYSTALREAQKLGFAEANPAADVEGFDAAYKAAILARVAFGASVKLSEITFEGITKISQADVRYAKEMGAVIKLIAALRRNENGIEISVLPTLVPQRHPLASVANEFNAIFVNYDAAGEQMYYGRGAGSLPTASAILADCIEIAKGAASFGMPAAKKIKVIDSGAKLSRNYLHIKVVDQPGVLAKIAGILALNNVSIDAVLQKETNNKIATLIIVTHAALGKSVKRAIARIAQLSVVKSVENVLPMGL